MHKRSDNARHVFLSEAARQHFLPHFRAKASYILRTTRWLFGNLLKSSSVRTVLTMSIKWDLLATILGAVNTLIANRFHFT